MNNAEVLIKFKGDTKDVDNSVKGLTKSMGSLTKSITLGNLAAKGISKAFSLISSNMDSAIKRVDTLNNFPKVMSNLGISTKEADKQIKRMSEELAGLPTTLDQGAMAVQRFTSKNSDVKKSTDIFLALNNALLAGGASTDIQATALEQLSQAYAKGKPDMMEWRSIQTAMPAQLKQVAIAMGYAGGNVDALGEDLRKGNVSMDKFMDTIIELNKKGTAGFKSFSKQARNSTAGIGTAITVAKTQVVKGITSMIEGLNNGLKKAKLGSISDIIANIGKKAKEVLDGVAKWLSKIDFKKVINGLIAIAKSIITVKSAMLAYKAVQKATAIANTLKSVKSVTQGFLSLIPAIKGATASQIALNSAMAISPIGIVVASLVGLTTGLLLMKGAASKTVLEYERLDKSLDDYNTKIKEADKAKQSYLDKHMTEINHAQTLYQELQALVDENGKVKSGYEDRVNFILGELNSALGLEMSMNNGVIEGYKEIQSQIGNVIEAKRAKVLLDAQEKVYNAAKDEEAQREKDYADAMALVNERTQERNKALKEIQQTYNLTEEQLNSVATTLKYVDENGNLVNLAFDKLGQKFKDADNALTGANAKLKTQSKAFEDNKKIINDYDYALEQFKNNNYQAVLDIYETTVSYNGKTTQETKKNLDGRLKSQQEYLEKLKKNEMGYNQEQLDREIQKTQSLIAQIKEEQAGIDRETAAGQSTVMTTWDTALENQLNVQKEKQPKFEQNGRSNVFSYSDGMNSALPNATSTAANIGNQSALQFNVSAQTYNTGVQVSQGFANGIASMGQAIKNTAAKLADEVINEMNRAAGVASPSRKTMETGKYLVLGLNKGINQNMNRSIATIDDYANKVTQAFAGGMATNISPQLAASSSLHYSPNVIVNNQMNMRTDPLGQVVGNIKTFANGSKNDYNYGMGS